MANFMTDLLNSTQILEALKHCHDNNFFHRDIKPENVLVSTVSTGHPPSRPSAASPGCLEAFQHNPYTLSPPPTPVRYVVKLADFGLAREITCDAPYTSYVSTRWYRAPEIILRADKYHAPVDMWAFGAMAAEIVALAPLFPGKDEIDQIQRICGVLGTPEDWRNSHNEIVGGGPWADGDKLTTRLNLVFKPVRLIMGNISHLTCIDTASESRDIHRLKLALFSKLLYPGTFAMGPRFATHCFAGTTARVSLHE